MEFTGELETHLTVCLGKTETVARLQAWGQAYGLKCLHIILERGDVTSQPMLTRRASSNLTGEVCTARRLKELLTTDGFQVVRIKIEAAPWNENVPQSLTEITNPAPEKYFENHIRILCQTRTDYTALVMRIKGRNIKQQTQKRVVEFSLWNCNSFNFICGFASSMINIRC